MAVPFLPPGDPVGTGWVGGCAFICLARACPAAADAEARVLEDALLRLVRGCAAVVVAGPAEAAAAVAACCVPSDPAGA